MSDDNVVFLDVDTTLAIPPERVLDGALKADLEEVIVLGWTKDGQMYAAGSTGDIADTLLLLELFKKELLSE